MHKLVSSKRESPLLSGWSALLAAVCLLALVAGCAKKSDDIELTFAPPTGVEFEESVETALSHSVGTRGLGRIQIFMIGRTVVTKSSAWKYSFDTSISQLDLTVNGRAVDNAALRSARSATYRMEILDNGEFGAAEGLYELTSKIARAALSDRSSARGGLSRSGSREAVSNDWYERVGFLAGKTVRMGDVLEMKSKVELPAGGTVTYLTQLTFSSREGCGTAQCVWILLEFQTDPAAVEALAGQQIEGLEQLLGPQASAITMKELWVEGSGRRLVDPETLLIHGENLERTAGITMQAVGGGEIELKNRLSQVYRYRYLSPGG